MAVAFRSKSYTNTTSTGLTGTEPGGVVQNDILFLWQVVGVGATGFTGPTGGWTLLGTVTGTNSSGRLYVIRRGASAPGFATSWGGGSYWTELSVTAWSGCDTVGTGYDTFTVGAANQKNPNAPNCPAVTTSVPNTLVVAFGMGWNGCLTVPWVAPAGYTIREPNTANNNLCIAEKALATATTEDPGAFTTGKALLDDVNEITVALMPPSSGVAATVGIKSKEAKYPRLRPGKSPQATFKSPRPRISGTYPTTVASVITTIDVPAASLTLTSQAPTETITVAVPAGALTLTGQVPTETIQVAVPAAALTLTTQAPTVSQVITIAVPAAALTLTTQTPTVSQIQTIAVPAAALTLTTQAPTVSQIQTIAVPAASLVLTSQAPSESLTVAVPAAALTLTTQAPTVTVSANTVISVPAGSLSLTTQAPTETLTVAVPSANLTLAAQVPTVTTPGGGGGVVTFDGSTNGTELHAYDNNFIQHPSYAGTSIIANDRVRQNNTTQSAYYHIATPPSADYSVFADVYVLSNNQQFPAVTGRMDTTANTMYYARYDGQSAFWTIGRLLAGANTSLGNVSATLTVGQSYALELRMTGTSISLYVDTVLTVGPITNSAITAAGQAGIRMIANVTPSDSVGYHLDNWTTSFASAGADTTISVPAASLVLTTQAPIETVQVAIPSAALTLTTQAPTVSVTGDTIIQVPTAGLGLSAFPPTIPGGAVAGDPSEHHYGHGHGGRRHKRLEILYIGNEVYAIPMEDVPELKERLTAAKKLYRDNKKRYTPVTVFGVPPEGEDFTVKVAISFDFGVWLAQFRANATDIELEQRLRAESMVKIEQDTRLRRRKLILTLLSGPDV